jgi:solute carrier family 25 phosphate transporter 23/24/25/41
MALELSSYDLLPQTLPSFARGFAAALIATLTCYPLDTVRRRIQLQAGRSVAWHVAAGGILREDGVGGLYRGFLPNALKNLPNKGVKLSVFDAAKKALTAAEAAYDEECVAVGVPPPRREEPQLGRRRGGAAPAAPATPGGKQPRQPQRK